MKKRVINYDSFYIREHAYTNLITSSRNVMHGHTFWEFAICLSGEYQNDIDGQRLLLSEGNVCLMRPEDVHNPHNYRNRHAHRDIYVPEEKMKRICDAFDLTLYDRLKAKPLQLNFYLGKFELDMLAKDLDYLGVLQNENSPDCDILLSVAVSYILGFWIKKGDSKKNIPEEIVALVNKIDGGAFLDNTIKEIAGLSYYSHAYVCKLFKKYMGMTLHDYVIKCKMEYSMHLIADPNLRIIDISNMIGYDVPSSYVNAFKKRYGMAPSEMRKQILKNYGGFIPADGSDDNNTKF